MKIPERGPVPVHGPSFLAEIYAPVLTAAGCGRSGSPRLAAVLRKEQQFFGGGQALWPPICLFRSSCVAPLSMFFPVKIPPEPKRPRISDIAPCSRFSRSRAS